MRTCCISQSLRFHPGPLLTWMIDIKFASGHDYHQCEYCMHMFSSISNLAEFMRAMPELLLDVCSQLSQ